MFYHHKKNLIEWAANVFSSLVLSIATKTKKNKKQKKQKIKNNEKKMTAGISTLHKNYTQQVLRLE